MDQKSEVYELGYLLLPSLAEGEFNVVAGKIKALVEAAGGQEIASEAPEKIDLAYTMTKTVGASRYVVSEAYIGWIKFDLPTEARALEGAEHPVNHIKSEIEKMEEVLRFLLIKAPRETSFTFAQARALLAEKEAKENAPVESEALPEEPVVQ